MKHELVHSLTESFEGHAQETENGVEYWLARDLQQLLGYSEWRNFEGVIKRAVGIIKHKHLNGKIEKVHATVKLGSGALRKITDYRLDKEAAVLLAELCSSYKLNNYFSIRNESVVMQLAEKYCQEKNISFQYQFRLDRFVFDCMIGNAILVEFDEPHHSNSYRQKSIDTKKNSVAKKNNFVVFRVNLDMDIIDLILFIEKFCK